GVDGLRVRPAQWDRRRSALKTLVTPRCRDRSPLRLGLVVSVDNDAVRAQRPYRRTKWPTYYSRPLGRLVILIGMPKRDWRECRGSALTCTSGKGHGSRAAPAKSIKPSLVK